MPRPYDKDVVLDDKGTLWVTTDDVKKVNRVIVVDDISHWCLTFYTQPTEEPVRHGHWEYVGGNLYRCSVCHKGLADDDNILTGQENYCGVCGAKMDEEVERKNGQ